MVGACNPSYLGVEVGESLEPKRQRLQWAEIVPLHSSVGDRITLRVKKKNKGQSQWPMPVVPALWEAKVDGLHEVRSLRTAWPTGKTLSLLKIQKLVGHGGAILLSQLLGRLTQENCLNP